MPGSEPADREVSSQSSVAEPDHRAKAGPRLDGDLTPGAAGRVLLVYTALRLGIVAVCYLVVWLIFRDLVPTVAIVMLALLIAGIVSLLALRRQSGRAGRAMARLRTAARERYEAARAAEDVDDDEDVDDPTADGPHDPTADGTHVKP